MTFDNSLNTQGIRAALCPFSCPRKCCLPLLAIVALIAGALLPFAFAPYGVYMLAIVATAALLFCFAEAQEAHRPRHAFLYGWLFGVSFFGIGASWIYISLHHYGFMAAPFAVFVTALFVAFLALFPAVQGYCLVKFFPCNVRGGSFGTLLLAFPATFTLCEWVRSWMLTGFPWLFLGYSQIDGPLRGIAPLGGVYGVSFAVAFIAGCLVGIWRAQCSKRPQVRLLLVIAIIAVWWGSAKLADVEWTQPSGGGQPLKVSLVQGNVPQEMKWQAENLDPILLKYRALTQKHWDSAIIIWPEAAIPTFAQNVPRFMQELDADVRKHGVTLLAGMPLMVRGSAAAVMDESDQGGNSHGGDYVSDGGKNDIFYNAIVSFGAGRQHEQYLKRHLVPFGEYLPLKPLLLWLHNYVVIPMSDFSRGGERQPLLSAMHGSVLIAPFICYEIAYPSLMVHSLPRAQLLLTVSDDSWFGTSLAATQHLEIARMRSLESGRYQLVSTNTGITAIIDQHGKIVAQAPAFQEYVLDGKVQPMSGATPWVSYGHYLWLVMVLLLIVAAVVVVALRTRCRAQQRG